MVEYLLPRFGVDGFDCGVLVGARLIPWGLAVCGKFEHLHCMASEKLSDDLHGITL